MSAPVFLGHDQAQLDALLDVRRRNSDWSDHLARFEARSAEVRRDSGARLDLRYGDQERERLDIFLPTGTTAAPPVNVFYHGGYWRSSEKERYSYVAEGFIGSGAACVIVEYALVPTVGLDELIRQCRSALAYVHGEAAPLGLDPGRIHVSGHSAGGQIVGMLMAAGWQSPFGLPADVVRGGCGISGIYDLEAIRCSYLNETLGLDRETSVRNSPSLLRPAAAAPLILAVGGDEGEEFLRQNGVMAAAWAAETEVTPIVMAGGTHYTAAEAIGDPASELGRAVLAQMGLAR